MERRTPSPQAKQKNSTAKGEQVTRVPQETMRFPTTSTI